MSNTINIDNKTYFIEHNAPGGVLHTKHLIEVTEKLYEGSSEFHSIEVYNTLDYGTMLVLDGMVQTSEKDEFIYHENIAHLPMFYHTNPKNVLIIGGGDGGVLREVLRHDIDHVTMVEIDGKVVELSKQYLPSISDGAFENPKTELIIGDGKAYVENTDKKFDVIILDLSDPDGPAELLITEEFYTSVKKALKPGSVVSVQSESLTEQPHLAKKINVRLNKVFASVKVHQAMIPTYQGGVFSITCASDNDLDTVDIEKIKTRYNVLKNNLQYYNPQVHFASAILPTYLEKALQ